MLPLQQLYRLNSILCITVVYSATRRVSRNFISMSMSIINLYSAELWSILFSTALCVLSGNTKISSILTVSETVAAAVEMLTYSHWSASMFLFTLLLKMSHTHTHTHTIVACHLLVYWLNALLFARWRPLAAVITKFWWRWLPASVMLMPLRLAVTRVSVLSCNSYRSSQTITWR